MFRDNYKQYKSKLREEFNYACVYCGVREPELGGVQSFHIDHYRPKNKFPDLKNTYNNLLYACRNCNQYKSDYWPNPFQSFLNKVVLNPREDHIDSHINKVELSWEHQTPKGFWNINRFRLNSPNKIQQRTDRANIERTIQRLETIHFQLSEQFEIAKNQDNAIQIKELAQNMLDNESQILTLKQKISGPRN